MIDQDLGASYVYDSYRGRWFRRDMDGRVYKLDSIEGESRGRVRYMASPLIGSLAEPQWGEMISIPAEEFSDMSVFQHPQLGYRHTSTGAGLYYFTRRISTHRGLHSGNLDTVAIAKAPSTSELSWEKKVSLIYNAPFVPMIEAITLLNDRGPSVRGFAITPQFAISRKSGDRDNYTLHYNGKAAGTCTRDGASTFRVSAVQRLFDKVA